MIIYSGNRIYGGVAQLGERLNGIQEVKSSILSVSTMNVVMAFIIFENKKFSKKYLEN